MNRFHRSVAILAQAYKNGTLLPGNSCACAVGNLVSARCNYEVYEDSPQHTLYKNTMPAWYIPVSIANKNATPGALRLARTPGAMRLANHQIESTGYDLNQIIAIERAFETGVKQAKLNGAKDPIYEGLVAVYEQLAIIDGISLKVKIPAELVFVK